MLVATENNWQKVEAVEFSQENVYITTATDEMMLHLSDYLVWLDNPEEASRYQISHDNDDQVLQTIADEPINNQQLTSQSALISRAKDSEYEQLLDSSLPLLEDDISSNLNISLNQGKLYIQTGEGEVVVEGENIRFWFQPHSLKNSSDN